MEGTYGTGYDSCSMRCFCLPQILMFSFCRSTLTSYIPSPTDTNHRHQKSYIRRLTTSLQPPVGVRRQIEAAWVSVRRPDIATACSAHIVVSFAVNSPWRSRAVNLFDVSSAWTSWCQNLLLKSCMFYQQYGKKLQLHGGSKLKFHWDSFSQRVNIVNTRSCVAADFTENR